MTIEAKRRLTDISFEHEGAHVALVSIHQGGPANGITTLITKATNDIDPAQIALKAAGQNQDQPLTHIEEPSVEQIEKSVHEQLMAEAVSAAVELEKSAGLSAVAEIQKALEDQKLELTKALEELAVVATEKAAAKQALRKAALTDAKVPADKLEATLKSLEALSDESFDSTVATMKAMAGAVDASALMTETGASGDGADSQEEEDATAKILKAKYPKQATAAK
ncbi:hypothetical protein D3C79_547380 [compost metagenome]